MCSLLVNANTMSIHTTDLCEGLTSISQQLVLDIVEVHLSVPNLILLHVYTLTSDRQRATFVKGFKYRPMANLM